MYKFEKDIAQNMMSIEVVDARRFALSIRGAMEYLRVDAGCYRLTDEQYYKDTMRYLDRMASRLEAKFQEV